MLMSHQLYTRKDGLLVTTSAERGSAWHQKQVRVTIEEIIDPQPAQPEPAAEMTAEEATVWLRADVARRAVSCLTDATWRKEYDGERMHLCGQEVFRDNLPSGKYRPLGLAARTQVTLEKELAESRAASKGLERACDDLRHQLADSDLRLNQLAEDNATLRDAAEHAVSTLETVRAETCNARNRLNSALNRTEKP
jgi:hypothetical protein